MRGSLWLDLIRRTRERLSEPLLWFPFPALIAFGLVIVLRGQLLSGFNHRLGTQADVVHLMATPLDNTGIWISVYQDKDQLVVVTDDHSRFSWPLGTRDMKDLKPFIAYLNKRTEATAFKTTLALETEKNRTRAVLAVDQKLKYIHIRPILFALVEAKISNYGFETRMVR
ncbi:MAG: hypothetical protein H7249_18765 [Chitinophagaceae bacterium]|nr:hypothetical protein [Oligoflexus sp.]